MRPLYYVFRNDTARFLDFLILFRDFSYDYDELITKSGISDYQKAGRIFDRLLELGLIEYDFERECSEEKGIFSLHYYRLNIERAKPFIDLYDSFIKNENT